MKTWNYIPMIVKSPIAEDAIDNKVEQVLIDFTKLSVKKKRISSSTDR